MVKRKDSEETESNKVNNPIEKDSKLTTFSKHTAGKLAVAKGRKFEDEVAELYRLQGADVIQNIEICNKKVDILATFTYPVKHRIIVECKDEKRAVDANQRVMQFYGLMTAARSANLADSAEIITRVPWGDAAKGFAMQTDVGLFTYTEKIAKLMDFTHYLQGLVDKFENIDPALPSEPALGKYYVDLSAEHATRGKAEKIQVIDIYVHHWLDSNALSRNLAIFGEYGAGKSSFCRKLACNLAATFLASPNSSRIPILLNLRDFIGKLDLEAYITSFLDRECGVPNPKINIFRKMNEAGIFLLIFDGFDEMAIKVDADKLESNLLEIEKFAASPGSKVVLTSRPEYFISAREEIESISPAANPLLNRRTQYEPLRLLPWDDEQIEQFLKKRVPLVEGAQKSWTFYRDNIKSIGGLSDLSQRPVLLDMIVKTLPTLIINGQTVNLPNLYRTYLTNEIKRQKVLKRRDLLITETDRLTLLQKLAASTYTNTTRAITFANARDLIEVGLNPPKHELEAHTRDFLTNSFLVRRGDTYDFSHKSIQEYLVAAQLLEETNKGVPEFFKMRILQPVIIDFIVEMNPPVDGFHRWMDHTRYNPFEEPSILGGNAATLLCSISKNSLTGKDLSQTSLAGANFSLADLRDTRFKLAKLDYCNFVGTKFFLRDIKEAYSIKDSIFSLFYINEKGDEEVDWSNKELLLSIQKEYNIGRSSFGTVILDTGDFLKDNSAASMLVLKVYDIGVLHALREYCSRVISNKVAIYWDEIEKMLETYPEARAIFGRTAQIAAAYTRDLMPAVDLW
jgi:NACHT domain/Restriction endonuclease/Pentapeptide repeats (8 copies)